MESVPSVQQQVKEKYGSTARAVAKSGAVQACCDPALRCCDPITTNLYSEALSIRYPPKLPAYSSMFLGAFFFVSIITGIFLSMPS